jgi:hypothetical protein
MNRNALFVFVAAAILLAAGGCERYGSRVNNRPGRASRYDDPTTAQETGGVGFESQDIISMCDQMMRDMLSKPELLARAKTPRVIIDAEYFTNEGSSRINKNMITDRLRFALNDAAAGKMRFIARHHLGMVDKEREIKREGLVDSGTITKRQATAGGDFRLGGRITTLDGVAAGGTTSRFHQIVFEMIDLESAEIVWGGMYQFKKSGQDDVIYR